MPRRSSVTIRDRVVELRRVKASELTPNPRNWRQHPRAQQDAMRGLLSEIGFAGALLVRETPEGLELIDGHLRANMTPNMQLPVLVLDVTEEEAEKLLATYDPLSAMAQPDQDALIDLLAKVTFESQAVNEMLAALREGQAQLAPEGGGLTDPDDIRGLPEELYVGYGDVWQLGDHRLMCGDSPVDYGRLLGSIVPRLVFTDPPYGINIVKGLMAIDGAKPLGRVRQPGGQPSGVLRGTVGVPGVVAPRIYRPVTGDDQHFDPTWLLSVGENQIIFGAPYFASRLKDGTTWLCWDKQIAERATFSAIELAWTSFTGHMRLYRHTWSGMVREGARAEELQDRVHPTQKPVGVFAAILNDYSDEADVIFDPYLGSGTTLIACEKLGRICYAMEIEPAYVQVAIERWQDYTGEKAVLLHYNEIPMVKS